MARAAPLKVYVTPAGFYDAVVAAPSQKAALEAWGAHSNLFGEKLACLETDEAWKTKALATPGEVLRKPRGDTTALMAKPAPARPPPKATRTEPKSKPPAPERKSRAAKPKPPADRSKLDTALAALADAQANLVDTQNDFSRRRDELEAEEARALALAAAEVTKAQAQRTREQAAFDEAAAQVSAFNAANQSA